MAGDAELWEFIWNTKKYISGALTDHLPSRCDIDDIRTLFPHHMEFQGYCPVSMDILPPGIDSLVTGSSAYVVEYAGKYYTFASHAYRELFMMRPWKYVDLKIPKQFVVKTMAENTMALPVVGYLEQTVAAHLNQALVSVGEVKPKYPFRSLDESANTYIGLFLKGAYHPTVNSWSAHNPKLKLDVRNGFKKELDSFKNDCALIPYLGKKMRHGLEASANDADLKEKMTQFQALKSKPPSGFAI
jgi:adenylate/nucleoside-diphosphate kinase